MRAPRPLAPALLASLIASAAACQGEGGPPPTPSSPPLLGAAADDVAAADRADRSCRVVLDRIERRVDGGWGGELLVGDGAPAGAEPRVLYRQVDGSWWEVAASATGEESGGLLRHRFDIEPGLDSLDFIPLVATGGVRWFDHNRIHGELQSYHVQGSRSIEPDPAACDTVIRFDTAWRETASDPVMRGRRLVVSYDPARLTTCRGTHNGHPAWGLRGFARFSPGGEQVDGSLIEFETVQGTPTTAFDSVPLMAEVPDGASGVEIWVENVGIGCSAYDSDFGRNYRWPVVAGPFTE